MDFYQLLSKYYDRLFPAAQQQVNFLTRQFPIPANLVDLACGSGNYTVAMAAKGHNLLGIELDTNMYELAKAKENETCKFLHGNMLELSALVEPGWEGMYCIGNSLVHLSSTDEVTRVLYQAYHVLAGSASLVIQIVNYDRWLAGQWQGFKDIVLPEGITFKRLYHQDNQYIAFEAILQDELGQVHTSTTRLLPISSTELEEVGRKVGFNDIKFYGGFDGSEFSLSSQAIVIVMQKGPNSK